MDMNGGASVKQIVRDLWSNKPLAITLLVGAAAVGYMLYKNSNGTAFVAPVGAATTPGTGSTFSSSYTQIINPPTSQPPSPGTPAPPTTYARIQTIFPAPKGSLSAAQHGAGKGDTNWWAYNTPAGGVTLANLAKFARINKGSIPSLVNYRNNANIFAQMGVDTTNPNSVVPGGWVISV